MDVLKDHGRIAQFIIMIRSRPINGYDLLTCFTFTKFNIHHNVLSGKTIPLCREEFVIHFGKPISPLDFVDMMDSDSMYSNRCLKEDISNSGSLNDSEPISLSKESLQRFTGAIRSAVEDLKMETDTFVQVRYGKTVTKQNIIQNKNCRHQAKVWSVPVIMFHIITVILRTIEAVLHQIVRKIPQKLSKKMIC